MRTVEILALSGLLGISGLFVFAWIMALREHPLPRLKRLAFTGGFTLLILIAMIGLTIGSGFSVQIDGVAYQFSGWQIETRVVDPLAHLYTLQSSLRAYVQNIQNEIHPLMAQTDLVLNNWEADLERQAARHDPGFSLLLWREKGSTIYRSVQCNVRLYNHFLNTAVNPTITIDLPQEQLHLDWFVTTGNEALDLEILAVIEEITAAWAW